LSGWRLWHGGRDDFGSVRLVLAFALCALIVDPAAQAKPPRSKRPPIPAIPSIFWGEWAEDFAENCNAPNESTRIILGPRRFRIQGDEISIGGVKVHNRHSVTVFGRGPSETFATFDHDPEKNMMFRDSEVSMHRCLTKSSAPDLKVDGKN
jgi:hypothetical protein